MLTCHRQYHLSQLCVDSRCVQNSNPGPLTLESSYLIITVLRCISVCFVKVAACLFCLQTFFPCYLHLSFKVLSQYFQIQACTGQNFLSSGPRTFGPTQPEPEIYLQVCCPYPTEPTFLYSGPTKARTTYNLP
jgi:hypothetical protein